MNSMISVNGLRERSKRGMAIGSGMNGEKIVLIGMHVLGQEVTEGLSDDEYSIERK